MLPFSIRSLGAALLLLAASSCGSDAPSPSAPPTPRPAHLAETAPAAPAPGTVTILKRFEPNAPTEDTLFQAMEPSVTGVDFVNPIDNEHPLSRLYISGFASSGIAAGDVDGDGLTDLYLTRGPGKNALYRQIALFQFENIAETAQVELEDVWSSGAAFADVNGDGHLDLYVCVYEAPNRLFLNDGNGRFADTAREAGVDVSDASLMAHFQDFDADGDLDFYLLTNRLYRAGGLPSEKPIRQVDGKPQILPEFQKYYRLEDQGGNRFTIRTVGRPDRLFRNDGKGTFEDVTQSAGISGDHYGLSATWFDYDQDGDPDLYVANDFKDPDRLYQNLGNGTFKDVIGEVVPHTPWYSMGSDAADMNNDGYLDMLVLDMSSTIHYKEKVNMGDMSQHQHFMDHAEPRQLMRNAYFLNSGAGRFLEAAHLSGLSSSDWSWAAKLADFDNDTRKDVFITNGMTVEMTNADFGLDQSAYVGREEWSFLRDKPRRTEPNMAFRNLTGFRFDDVSRAWGLDHDGMSYAAAWADLNKDGNLDLVVANLDENVSVYRNRGQGSHRLLLSLRGRGANTHGIGATVTVRSGSLRQTGTLNPATGFLSSNEPILHFGLGELPLIEELTVDWPSGTQQVLTGLEANTHILISEPLQGVIRESPPIVPLFTELTDHSLKKHEERPYDDFQAQPLLPNKLSQLGPGLAVEDLDGDGNDDFVVGAARGELPSAHFMMEDGYKWGGFTTAKYEQLCEDMAPLLLDFDGDGDLDWFVVSGGVEHGETDQLLRDRLYVQRGPGRFVKDTAALPAELRFSGGPAAAADFDRDGDLDLAIGGRVTPGQYPLSPGSVLLRNDTVSRDQPRLTDATTDLAPGLAQTERVTGLLWSDVNGDGWIDLLATTEWGPVLTFLNHEGRLEDETARSGIASLSGWWNGIAGRDFDHDGDIDYAVTNFGHNTKYHPSPDHPTQIYYGTFDEDPTPHIIEAKVKDGMLLPVRGKSCSQNAMPFLRTKFPTFHDFAVASLPEIYSDQALGTATRFEVTTLDNALLINDGTGHFEFRPLPDLAQIAPGFGVVATEINGDGHADLYLAQNFFTPQRETGKMAGGLSALLLGDGTGGFRPVWPSESGLLVPGDAKGLATTDINGDARADFIVTNNDGRPQLFQNQIGDRASGMPFAIRLKAPSPNFRGIGSRVSLVFQSGQRQTAEVYAGGSYLSQSSPVLFFASPADDPAQEIEVRWPSDVTSRHALTQTFGILELSHP